MQKNYPSICWQLQTFCDFFKQFRIKSIFVCISSFCYHYCCHRPPILLQHTIKNGNKKRRSQHKLTTAFIFYKISKTKQQAVCNTEPLQGVLPSRPINNFQLSYGSRIWDGRTQDKPPALRCLHTHDRSCRTAILPVLLPGIPVLP